MSFKTPRPGIRGRSKVFRQGEEPYKKIKKNIHRFQILLIIFVLVFALVPTTAKADTDYSSLNQTYLGKDEVTADELKDFLYSNDGNNLAEKNVLDFTKLYEELSYLQGLDNPDDEDEEEEWEEGQFPFTSMTTASGVQQAEKAVAYWMSAGMSDKVDSVIEDVYLPIVRSGGSASATGSVGAQMMIMGTIAKAIIGVGYVFVFVAVAVMFLREVSSGNVTYDTLLQVTMMLLIGMIFVREITLIMGALDNLGDYIRVAVSNKVSSSGTEAAQMDAVYAVIQENFGEGSTASDWLGAKAAMENGYVSAQLLILFLLMCITSWSIALPMYAVVIELLLRRAFAPLAIGSFIREGFHGPATQFMKQYLACYVRIAMMYVITVAGSLMLKSVISNGGADMKFTTLLIQVTFIRLAIKGVAERTDQLANSVMGGR